MIDPSASSAAASSTGSSSSTSDADLAAAFSKVVASMAVGLVENNKPQIHDANDD